MTALLLAAAIACAAPGGTLVLRDYVPEPIDGIEWASSVTGLAQTGAYVARHPGAWRKVEWRCTTLTLWPHRQHLVAVYADGSRDTCDEVICMSPPREEKPTHARGRLVYTAVGATKGEPLFHAWFVNHDAQEAKKDLKQLGQAMKDARDGRDPGIPEQYVAAPSFPCGYCSYRGHCFPKKVNPSKGGTACRTS